MQNALALSCTRAQGRTHTPPAAGAAGARSATASRAQLASSSHSARARDLTHTRGAGCTRRREGEGRELHHSPHLNALTAMLATRCMRRMAPVGSRSMANFTGVWPIMATPFNADETVDLEGFSKCISFMKDAGCDGATIIGVLGESNRLLDNEREALIKTYALAAAWCTAPNHAVVGLIRVCLSQGCRGGGRHAHLRRHQPPGHLRDSRTLADGRGVWRSRSDGDAVQGGRAADR